MIFAKSNKLLFSIIFTVFSLSSCVQQKDENVMSGYVASRDFQDYIKGDNKDNNEYTAKIFFSVLGEESFLFQNRYDTYIIYLYKEIGDSMMNAYIIKTGKDITYSSIKKFVPQNPIFYIEKSNPKPIYQSFQVRSSVFYDDSVISEFNFILEKAISSTTGEYYPLYDKPFRIAFYYYKKKYGRITDFQTEPKLLEKLDKLFKESELF